MIEFDEKVAKAKLSEKLFILGSVFLLIIAKLLDEDFLLVTAFIYAGGATLNYIRILFQYKIFRFYVGSYNDSGNNPLMYKIEIFVGLAISLMFFLIALSI